jgi:dTMP kinase
MSGLFITFEGVEGSGKSTQLVRQAGRLRGLGYQVVATREPGGTPVSEAVRALLLDPENSDLSPMAELLLYEAARAQHVDERIRPALEAGAIVLSDRFADSTTAYQGAGRAIDPEHVARLHAMATRGVWPDLTLLFDLPVTEGLRRAGHTGKPDRIEREPVAFHERVRAGFLALARFEPDRIQIVDAAPPPDAVAAVADVMIDRLLDAHGYPPP